MRLRLYRWQVCCLLLALSGGCATVQPWERGRLADPAMALEGDPNQLVYESREGSSGGGGAAGGGCACKR